jgi:hypothetical protein
MEIKSLAKQQKNALSGISIVVHGEEQDPHHDTGIERLPEWLYNAG